MFTQNEIDTIIEKKLNKDFFDITLKQQKKRQSNNISWTWNNIS